jgi:hypothetical protein
MCSHSGRYTVRRLCSTARSHSRELMCGGEQLWLVDRGEPPTLLFDMPRLIFDDGRGLALRMRATVRSLRIARALAERLNASMSSSIVFGSSGTL